MGEKSDITAIKEIIAQLDVKLEQVMIEAAIFKSESEISIKPVQSGYTAIN